MSGYSGQFPESDLEKDKKEVLPYKNIGVLSAKLLREKIKDPSSEKRVVERLAEAAVSGSVEAKANLCLYMNLDLQDMVLVKGVINGDNNIEAEEYKQQLLEYAYDSLDKQDICGYIAFSAIAGYFPPPEVIEVDSITRL